MTVKNKELLVIQGISKRIVEAQRKIRILDHVKWDESIKTAFLAKKGTVLPAVNTDYYTRHPLPFNVSDKIHEFRLILRDTQRQLGEYSAITRLVRRQCEEYIRAVLMLEARGTPEFVELSRELYGSVADVFYPGGPRLSEMGSMLFDILTNLGVQLKSDMDDARYTADEATELLQVRLNHFFDSHPVKVMVSDGMIADAAAGADTIRLSRFVKFSERQLRYLEVHEGWVHVGTTLNGSLQPHCSFLSKGAPSCSVIQEGLAVLTEVVTFSSYPSRMRKITNRVIAIDKIAQGADFIEVYHYFLSCGFSEEDSYNQCMRVFRGSIPTGGPFTKDLSYAKGFVLIYNFILYAISQHRIDVVPLLFSGKITLDDLPLLLELQAEGILNPPRYLPPQFRDLSALSVWLSLSLYLNQFDFKEIQRSFRFLLM